MGRAPVGAKELRELAAYQYSHSRKVFPGSKKEKSKASKQAKALSKLATQAKKIFHADKKATKERLEGQDALEKVKVGRVTKSKAKAKVKGKARRKKGMDVEDVEEEEKDEIGVADSPRTIVTVEIPAKERWLRDREVDVLDVAAVDGGDDGTSTSESKGATMGRESLTEVHGTATDMDPKSENVKVTNDIDNQDLVLTQPGLALTKASQTIESASTANQIAIPVVLSNAEGPKGDATELVGASATTETKVVAPVTQDDILRINEVVPAGNIQGTKSQPSSKVPTSGENTHLHIDTPEPQPNEDAIVSALDPDKTATTPQSERSGNHHEAILQAKDNEFPKVTKEQSPALSDATIKGATANNKATITTKSLSPPLPPALDPPSSSVFRQPLQTSRDITNSLILPQMAILKEELALWDFDVYRKAWNALYCRGINKRRFVFEIEGLITSERAEEAHEKVLEGLEQVKTLIQAEVAGGAGSGADDGVRGDD